MASRYRGVVIGSSLGGIDALQAVLGGLRTGLEVPVVVAHHLGSRPSLLPKVLGRVTGIPVRWAVDGEPVTPATVFLCPPRTEVRWDPDGTFTVRGHDRGSSLGVVDELFASAADTLGPEVLAVVLTGAGSDGRAGARAVHDSGGTVVVQDPDTAAASGMPGAVVGAGLADLSLPLSEIPEVLDRVIGRGSPLPLPEVLAAEAVFAAGGETGALMATTDWTLSALGPVERWPAVLRSTLAMVLANQIAMAVLWGPDHLVLYNDGTRAIFGSRFRSALGHPLLSVLPETEPVNGPLLRQVRETGRAVLLHDVPAPHQLLHGSLQEAYHTWSYSPLRDGPEMVGMLCTFIDTTAQVQGRRRLRTLHRLAVVAGDVGGDRGEVTEAQVCEQAAAALAEDTEDVAFALLYLVDRAGTALRLAAATGLTPGSLGAPRRLSLTGRAPAWPVTAVTRRGETRTVDDLAERFPGLVCGPHPEPPTRALVLPAGHRTDGTAAAVVVLGLSSRIPLDAAYRSFLDLVGERVGAALVAARRRRDGRERIAALATLDRDRTEFFTGMSHEFRTPLALALGALEQLLDAPDGRLRPDEIRAAARLAHRNGLRLLKLVNTLLEFAQLGRGRTTPRREDVDLAVLTADLAGVFRSAFERAGVELVVDCPPLGAVPVDPAMWERIVLNLVSNALKHTFDGSVTVALRRRAHHVELDVSDTGTGIPPDDQAQLFTRFHRVRGARARGHGGSGLGLALVRRLTRLHQGSVRVRSTPGEGSRFTVWVPVSPPPAAEHGDPDHAHPDDRDAHRRAFADEADRWLSGREPARPAAPAPAEPRPAVLVVDDDPGMLDHVRRLLADRYAVTAVPDGAQALDALADRRFDLVLADVQMPDGLELLVRIRADPTHRATQVVLLAALDDPRSTVAGLAAGAHDYVSEPFTAQELLGRVEARLELARLRAEPTPAAGTRA